MDTPAKNTPSSAATSPLSDLTGTPSMLSSSPPLSVMSRSPSLPSQHCPASAAIMNPSSRYPSPSSTATQSGSASPLKLQDSVEVAEIQVRTDGLPPPAKRRKVAERKPRSTEHLDLDNRDEAGEAQLDRLLSVLRRKKKIVVVAGAGISVSAGSRSCPR